MDLVIGVSAQVGRRKPWDASSGLREVLGNTSRWRTTTDDCAYGVQSAPTPRRWNLEWCGWGPPDIGKLARPPDFARLHQPRLFGRNALQQLRRWLVAPILLHQLCPDGKVEDGCSHMLDLVRTSCQRGESVHCKPGASPESGGIRIRRAQLAEAGFGQPVTRLLAYSPRFLQSGRKPPPVPRPWRRCDVARQGAGAGTHTPVIPSP